MEVHSGSVPAKTTRDPQADLTLIYPTLGPLLAEPLARLRRFTRELANWRELDGRGVSSEYADEVVDRDDGLRAAAEAVVRGVQERLAVWEQGCPTTSRSTRHRRQSEGLELEMGRSTALAALALIGGGSKHGGAKYAKLAEIEIANGRPLALCVGPRPFRFFEVDRVDISARRHFPVSGCKAVFPDSLRTSGRTMWSTECPSCRHAQLKRDQQRKLQKAIDDREPRWPGIAKSGRPPRARLNWDVTFYLD